MNQAQIERMLKKLVRLEETLEPYIFSTIGEVEVKRFETAEQYHQIPQDDSLFVDTAMGDTWGGEGVYCWFKGKVSLPEEYRGQKIYIMPKVGGFEGMLLG